MSDKIEPYRRAAGTVDAGADFSRNVSAIAADVKRLRTSLAGSSMSLASLQAALLALEARVSTAEGDITSVEGDITALQADLLALQTDLLALDTSLGTLDTRVSYLENSTLLNGELIIAALLDYNFGPDPQPIPHSLGREYVGAITMSGAIDQSVVVMRPGSLAGYGMAYDATAYVYVSLPGVASGTLGTMTCDLWVF